MKADTSFLRGAVPLPARQLEHSGLTLHEIKERRRTGMWCGAGSAFLAG